MDYIEDDAQPAPLSGSVRPEEQADLELDSELDSELDASAAAVDPFLRDLLPEDRQERRRVVTALLRAVLAERKVT